MAERKDSESKRVRIDSVSSHLGVIEPNDAAGLGHQFAQAELRRAIDNQNEESQSSDVPLKTIRRHRTISGSKSEDHMLTTDRGQKVYTKGRPPWYDRAGKRLKQPFLIGICGGSASGKTTVARRIIERLEMPWVTVLSMDSFYKVLNTEEKERASQQNYNFDHPAAFDFDLLEETLKRLRDGKSVDVPVYDFTSHSRDKNAKVMYGADVLIFEGILSFFRPAIADMMDIKVFVDTDSDTRLARRLKRDTAERGRDTAGVIDQYFKFVKPAFDNFIGPAAKLADIIIPRGGDNEVAIDLIVRQVKNQLAERGYDATKNRLEWSALRSSPPAESDPVYGPLPRPDNLFIVNETPQLKGLHTIIRNRETPRDEFIFVAERLMQILIEYAMTFIPYEPTIVVTPDGEKFEGMKRASQICGVAIMRAGETLERSLRGVIKDCKIGKILIQTNDITKEPELYYLRLPKNVSEYKVLLMDANVATGAASIMAIRILLDHDVKEENITLLSLLMAENGVNSIAYAFPKVKLVTTAVDSRINEMCYIIPGMGNFGDRYYGTDAVGLTSDNENDDATESTFGDDDELGSVDSAIEGSATSGKAQSDSVTVIA